MKHRDFMDLTYKEIVRIVTDVLSDNFSDIKINSIQRDYDAEKIQVIVMLNVQGSKGNEIILRMPTVYDSGIYAPVNSHTTEDRAKMDTKYQQFILATLYHDFLKDNPYLEKDDNEKSHAKEIVDKLSSLASAHTGFSRSTPEVNYELVVCMFKYLGIERDEKLAKAISESVPQNYKQEEAILTPDMQRFLDGKIAVHIENHNDYSDFINKLQQFKVIIDTHMTYYDPKYPYIFMQNSEDKCLNANMTYENILRFVNCNVKECVKYADLDFVKRPLSKHEIVSLYNTEPMYFTRPDGSDAMVQDNHYSIEDCIKLYEEGCNFYLDKNKTIQSKNRLDQEELDEPDFDWS